MPIFLKKIICFIFRKRIAEIKAKQIVDSYTIKTVTTKNTKKAEEIVTKDTYLFFNSFCLTKSASLKEHSISVMRSLHN